MCRFQNWMKTATHNSSKQTKRIQSNKTQVYFNSIGCTFISAICFGLYVGHLQACQYKNHKKEDTIRISGVPFLSQYFYNVKTQNISNKSIRPN